MDKQPSILITGANGFIGRALGRLLLKEGRRVIATTRTVASQAGLPAEIESHVSGPLENLSGEPPFLTGADALVHLAARVHMMGTDNARHLDVYRKVNVEGTRKLALVAARAGVRRFVFISSVKAIGDGSPAAYGETTPETPKDPYGISKLEAERELREIGDRTGMETIILRLPLVYGPEVRANFFRLLQLVDRGMPLPLASVDNRRSMIYIGNLVDAIRICLQHNDAAGEAFMVSDGEDMSTPGLIRKIAAAMGKKPRLLPCPPGLLRLAGVLAGKGAEADRLMSSLTVDISKISDRLGWAPIYNAEQGINETVAWYRGTYTRRK